MNQALRNIPDRSLDMSPHTSPLVLVVDDDEAIRNTLSQVIRDENYQTITAANGAEAIELAAMYHPAVIFLDIWMPGMDGIDTLSQIKIASPLSQVVMISGHATIATALEATKRGALDFIEKPLDIEGVICTLRKAFNLICKSDIEMSHFRDEALATKPISAGAMGIAQHLGILSKGLAGRNRGQRTLKHSAVMYGQGLHSGQKSGLVLEPLPVDSGIYFSRMGASFAVPAVVDYVDSTSFATTIRSQDVSASTIEHLMAALHVYGISNLLVKCNGEVPIFDGSAEEFCRVIEEIGIEEQGGEWFEIVPDRDYHLEVAPGERISLFPSEKLTVSYFLEYPAPVGKQQIEVEVDSVGDFRKDISSARTFGFMKDVERLQKAGLAAGGRLDNFILIGNDGAVNTELRFADELARHKILDILGDLFLLGRPLRARVVANMTGHSDNVKLLAQMRDAAYEKR